MAGTGELDGEVVERRDSSARGPLATVMNTVKSSLHPIA